MRRRPGPGRVVLMPWVELPEEFEGALRDRLAEVDVSKLLEEAIRERLACSHVELVCRACSAPIDREYLVRQALARATAAVDRDQMIDEALARDTYGASPVGSAPIGRDELVDRVLSCFYQEALWELADLVHQGGTAEGAGRILKRVAMRLGVSAALRIPLPRPTVAQREVWRDREFVEQQTGRGVELHGIVDKLDALAKLPREADSRARHPTARRRPGPTPGRPRYVDVGPEADSA